MYPCLSRVLGLLLLAAAALKVFGLPLDPVAHTGLFGTTWFRVAVIQFEVILGLWLLWGGYPVAAWAVTLATFTAFTVISFQAGWVGQASCGCFGSLQVNPWYAFALDVGVVSALAVFRPRLGDLRGAMKPQLLNQSRLRRSLRGSGMLSRI